MDERIREIVDGVVDVNGPDPSAIRDRVWELFFEVQDENGRIELLSMYDAAMRLALGRLTAETPEFDGLRQVVEIDKCAFVILEAMIEDAIVDVDEFDRIVDREIKANRMHGREFAMHAKSAAKVLRDQRETWNRRKGLASDTLH